MDEISKAQTARTRSFLAWQMVWDRAQAVSIMSSVLIPWTGEHALEVLSEGHFPESEAGTALPNVADYFGVWR